MVPILHALPADWTAAALTNYVINEKQSLKSQSGDPYRVVVLDKGYFYTKDLQVFDDRHRELTKGTDYQCLVMSPVISKKTGFAACAIIVIKNPTVGDAVYVNARMVGGEYCSFNEAIIDQALSLLAGGVRKVYWKNIKDKPNDYRANGHFHTLWQLYKFTKPTQVLMRMTAAVNLGTKTAFDGIYSKYRLEMDQIEAGLTDIENRLTTHIEDKEDPHVVTKGQVGLGSVQNASVASQLQAEQRGGGIMNYYATPLRAKQSVNVNFTDQLVQHLQNLNNPHQITANTINAYTNWETTQIANQYYNRGETTAYTTRFMGATWDVVKNDVRWGIPIYNIVSGVFPWYVFSPTQPQAGQVLMATASKVTSWLPASYVIFEWEKKANRIYYTTAKVPYRVNGDLNAQSAFLGSVAGTWQPNDSMLVFRWAYDWVLGTGNGAITTHLETIGMATMQNGQWVFPGY